MMRYAADLSIVVPTYNRRRFLGSCLKSILTQTFEYFELIVIDDGSRDGTDELLRQIKDPRLVHIRQANRGEAVATNLGLRVARGSLITWVHSDDVLPPRSLARRVAALRRAPRVGFCHGDINLIDRRSRVIRRLPAVNWSAGRVFRDYLRPPAERPVPYMVHHTTMMFRRGLLERIGFFDETLPFSSDLDWMLRALRTVTMTKAPGILYHYRQHPGQLSVQSWKLVDRNALTAQIQARYAHGPLETSANLRRR